MGFNSNSLSINELFPRPPFKWWARPKNVFSSSKKHKKTLKINLNSLTPIPYHQPLNPRSNLNHYNFHPPSTFPHLRALCETQQKFNP